MKDTLLRGGSSPSRMVLRLLLRHLISVSMLLVPAASAIAVEGLPGSSWGTINRSVNGLTGSGGMGYINQGIDWFTLPGGIVFNTYAEYRYRTRTKQRDYYDAEGPAVGLELRKWFLQLGMDYYWERFPVLGERSNNREVYLRGYYDWDLARISGISLPHTQGLPGSVWASFTRDVNGLTGSGAMGYVNQGIDWFTLPGGIVFNTYAEYRHRSRTKLSDYYDAEGPAVGMEFKWRFLRTGLDYYWERFPGLGEHSNYLELYLTWYIDWDLMKRPK